MIDIDQCACRKFLINEKDLIQTVISVTGEHNFPKGGPSLEDYEKLRTISSDNCSNEIKEKIISFMLKFGKGYNKDFPLEIDSLRTFDLKYLKHGHRDHVCHSFRVWSLGLWFYQKGFNRFINPLHENVNRFDFVWYLAAFYHDIGYIEKHKFHGGDGAQLLLRNINTRFNGNWTTEAIHAIVAICLHDKKEPVDLKKDPYSVLLILCDELQEWGRNILNHDPEGYFEIDKLQICLNLDNPNPSIDIIIFYPFENATDIKKLKEYTKSKEEKFRNNLTNRIKNLMIVVRCQSYPKRKIQEENE